MPRRRLPIATRRSELRWAWPTSPGARAVGSVLGSRRSYAPECLTSYRVSETRCFRTGPELTCAGYARNARTLFALVVIPVRVNEIGDSPGLGSYRRPLAEPRTTSRKTRPTDVCNPHFRFSKTSTHVSCSYRSRWGGQASCAPVDRSIFTDDRPASAGRLGFVFDGGVFFRASTDTAEPLTPRRLATFERELERVTRPRLVLASSP